MSATVFFDVCVCIISSHVESCDSREVWACGPVAKPFSFVPTDKSFSMSVCILLIGLVWQQKTGDFKSSQKQLERDLERIKQDLVETSQRTICWVVFGYYCVADRSPALKFSPCYFSESPPLELPRVRPEPSVKIHQSWKYPCTPDPASPLQSLAYFWCCPSPVWPRASTQSHGDLQRRQPTRLLLALFSLISDFHCWVNSWAGSLCFCPERGEPQL